MTPEDVEILINEYADCFAEYYAHEIETDSLAQMARHSLDEAIRKVFAERDTARAICVQSFTHGHILRLTDEVAALQADKSSMFSQIVKHQAEIDALQVQVEAAKKLVGAQAEDAGLWFAATTAPEAYLQQELRRLHAVVEGDSSIAQEQGND